MTPTPHPAISEAREALNRFENMPALNDKNLLLDVIRFAEAQAVEIGRQVLDIEQLKRDLKDVVTDRNDNANEIDETWDAIGTEANRHALLLSEQVGVICRERDSLTAQVAGLKADLSERHNAHVATCEKHNALKLENIRLKAALELAKAVIAPFAKCGEEWKAHPSVDLELNVQSPCVSWPAAMTSDSLIAAAQWSSLNALEER